MNPSSESNPKHKRKSIFSKQISKLLDGLLGIKPEVIPVMTYEWIVRYFTTIHLYDPKVKEAFVLRKAYKEDSKLTQLTLVFLDKNNESIVGEKEGKPYIREFLVELLDDELEQQLDESKDVLGFSFG